MGKFTFLVLLIQLFRCSVSANVVLPKIFQDHMVLQRGQKIQVWGWSDPGEKIAVAFQNQLKTVIADNVGRWRIKLDATSAGGPYQLFVKGKNQIILNDVMIGEVWLCSGQSNMQMPIGGWGKINNYQEEIARADYPLIRRFDVARSISPFPKNDVETGEWTICSPQTAGDFSATAYFFAREIHRQLNVPIGIITSTWGGSMIESWISREAFEQSEFKNIIQSVPADIIERQLAQRDSAFKNGLVRLQGEDLTEPDTRRWKDEAFDDSPWKKMYLPGIWEERDSNLLDMDGIVWFRRSVFVDDLDATKPARISIGEVHDSHELFLNGSKIAEGRDLFGQMRIYDISTELLKAGRNTIAVRIEDIGGWGGMAGDADMMSLESGNSRITLAGEWRYRVEKGYAFRDPNSYPTLLYNGMISPIISYGIKGVIWYQGESNTSRAYEYRTTFQMMINDWRKRWDAGDFPFYFVQLAAFDANGGNSDKGSMWAELREAQATALNLPNTGMAVASDLGDANDIHPKNKQEVGKRLAQLALEKSYNLPVASGSPSYSSMKILGNKVVVSFNNTYGALSTKNENDQLRGFEVAGADRKFYRAQATPVGDNVIVQSGKVQFPVAVRYAWADDTSEANLYNKAGLPASPFRTDNWPGVTDTIKYKVDNSVMLIR